MTLYVFFMVYLVSLSAHKNSSGAPLRGELPVRELH